MVGGGYDNSKPYIENPKELVKAWEILLESTKSNFKEIVEIYIAKPLGTTTKKAIMEKPLKFKGELKRVFGEMGWDVITLCLKRIAFEKNIDREVIYQWIRDC